MTHKGKSESGDLCGYSTAAGFGTIVLQIAQGGARCGAITGKGMYGKGFTNKGKRNFKGSDYKGSGMMAWNGGCRNWCPKGVWEEAPGALATRGDAGPREDESGVNHSSRTCKTSSSQHPEGTTSSVSSRLKRTTTTTRMASRL